MLLPSQAAIDFKIKRSHFVSEVFHNGDEAVSFITDPEKFGWKMKDNLYKTVFTDLVPMLDIDTESTFCSGLTNWRSMRCKFKKNNFRRIENCSCVNCEIGAKDLGVLKTSLLKHCKNIIFMVIGFCHYLKIKVKVYCVYYSVSESILA